MEKRASASHSDFIESLKPGDKVAVYSPDRYGLAYTVPKYEVDTITRITPKRSKIEFASGRCLMSNEFSLLDPTSEEIERLNIVAQKRHQLWGQIYKLEERRPKGRKALDNMSFEDGDLDRAIELTGELLRLPGDDT